MGNYSSCFKFKSTSFNMAKLVDSHAHMKLVELPMTVAEVMLENPGFVPTSVDELMRNHRVPAVKADDVLLGRKVYLLVPVDKVNTRLSEMQLAAIDSLVCSCNNKNVRSKCGGSKVSPVLETGSSGGHGSVEDLVKGLSGQCTRLLAGHRYGHCKAWKPALDPILEVC